MPPAHRPFRLFVAFALACVSAFAAPLGGGGKSHVQASLVAADTSAQPGREVLVALRLVHDEHWHTYWVNPGTGLATTLTWKLPPGWKAGEIQWPTPHVLRDHTGTIIGQGYDGDLLLPVVLTPPADLKPGSSVKIAASAEWLMCADVCIPGNSDVATELNISTEPPQPDATWGSRIRATIEAMPRADAAWDVSAQREGKTIVLRVAPTNGATALPRGLWFFSQDGLIAYDQPQPSAQADGGVTLTLTISSDAPAGASRLVGVLSSESGWNREGTLHGLKVDTALGGGAATTTAGENKAANGVAALPAQPAGGLGGTLVLALIGGLILNLMPCVFPVLGIKILGFVNQAGHDRRRVVTHGLVFTLGVLLSFWTLAGVLAILRASGDQLGWGFQLQSPVFVYGLAVLMLVFGMNMSGVFEFGLSATAVGSDLQMKSGYAGSFFSGV
jgi:thiol:disulfide interchange protein DsbD